MLPSAAGTEIRNSVFYTLNKFRIGALALLTVVMGCAGSDISKRRLVWDFSQGPFITVLSGGSWTPNQPGLIDESYVYYVNGPIDSLSVILPKEQRFDFEFVNRVGARKKGASVASIDIATCGYDDGEVVERLKDMHKHWKGDGIGDINEWRKSVSSGGQRSFPTLIRRFAGHDEPEITATIWPNGGDRDHPWHIIVTFGWPTP